MASSVAEMMREEDSESDEEEDPLSKLQNMNLGMQRHSCVVA